MLAGNTLSYRIKCGCKCVIFMLVNIKKLAVLEVTMTNTPIPVCKLHQDIFVDNIFGAFS